MVNVIELEKRVVALEATRRVAVFETGDDAALVALTAKVEALTERVDQLVGQMMAMGGSKAQDGETWKGRGKKKAKAD